MQGHMHSHSNRHGSTSTHRSTTRRRTAAALGLLVLPGTAACSTVGASDGGGEEQSVAGTVVLVTHDSFAIGKPLKTAFEEESQLVELVAGTEDSTEGVASFIERRPTEFKGW